MRRVSSTSIVRKFHDVICRDIPVADARVISGRSETRQRLGLHDVGSRRCVEDDPIVVHRRDRTIGRSIQSSSASTPSASARRRREIKSSHVPFVSHPKEVAKVIEAAATANRSRDSVDHGKRRRGRIRRHFREEIAMSVSTAAMTPSTKAIDSSKSGYNTPVFWEHLWRTEWSPLRRLLHHHIGDLRLSAAGRRITRRTRRVLQRRSHADPDRRRVLWPEPPQPPMVRGGAQDHPGGCGARRWGAAATASSAHPRQRCPSCSDLRGRSARVLDRRLRQSTLHVRSQRFLVGRRRLDVVPARDAHHVWSPSGSGGPG